MTYFTGWKTNIQKNVAHVGCGDDSLQCMFLELLDLLKAGLLLSRVFERFIERSHFLELFLHTSKIFLCHSVFAIHVYSCMLQKEEPCKKFLFWEMGSINLFDFSKGFLEKNLVLHGWNLISSFYILHHEWTTANLMFGRHAGAVEQSERNRVGGPLLLGEYEMSH
jgi:hypothetical protein